MFKLLFPKTEKTSATLVKEINWPNDAKNKVIGLRDVVAKSIKLRILATSDNLASGKEVLFFMAKE